MPLLPSVTEPPAPVATLLTVSVRSDDRDSARLLAVETLLSVRPEVPVESVSEKVSPVAEMLYEWVCAPLVLWFAVSASDVSCLLFETETLPADPIDRLLALVDAVTLPFVFRAFRLTLLSVIRPDPPMVGLNVLFA
ncbi:hypothetical protein D3C73_1135950 [compost metagenome]